MALQTSKPAGGSGSPPAVFDPLDPDADPPRLVLTEEQVWRCRTALQVFERKLRQPAAILDELQTLPARRDVLQNTKLFTAALSPANYKERNRHAEILPFDETRIRLQSSTVSQTSINDYINASLVKTEGKDKTKFICTQAPIPKTFEQFWQMVYENCCPAIVMVTPVYAGKCDEYLPIDMGQGDYGNFNVKITKTRQAGELVLRRLEVRLNNKAQADTRVHSVLHVRYAGWPDDGVPHSNTCVGQVMNRLYHIPRDHPIVVHCSAGIGRTGACITILNTVERVLRGEWAALDLAETIRKFRAQRLGIVGSRQYMLCYSAIVDELKYLISELGLLTSSDLKGQ